MRCWAAMGIEVHVCPTAPLDAHLLEMKLEDRGVVYHAPRDWPSVEGLHCIAYCNDVFLSEIAAISRHARSTTFVNCMSWNFAKELEAQEQGLIRGMDLFRPSGRRTPEMLAGNRVDAPKQASAASWRLGSAGE
ncbi:MAG: hypothetical protein R3C19_17090 [Planctomycetaceae bacterium]